MTTLRQIGACLSRKDLAGFQRLIREYPEHLYNDRGWENWMSDAARGGHLPFVEFLVSMGVDVNAPRGARPDDTSLDAAAHENQLEVARWLLERGARINFAIGKEIRCSALTGAINGGHLEMVKLLVEHGADVNATGGLTSPLGYASNYPEIAAYLRTVGARE